MSTWKDPSTQPGQLQGKKVGAFVLAKDETVRRTGEDTLARELNQRGVRGIPGYTLIPRGELTDKDKVRQRLTQAGIDATVVMRVVDTRQEVSYYPGAAPYYGSFYGYWDYGWATAAHPGYATSDTVVRVETLVYSVPDNKLLWGGVSETVDPSRLDTFIKEVADAAANEMRKQGLTK
jgi:hypothetical protein